MKKITVVYDVYNFDELSKEAQDKAREKLSKWIIESHFDVLGDELEDLLKEYYDIDGKVFYSLGFSQGDGLHFDSDDLMTAKFYDLMMKMVDDGDYAIEDKEAVKQVIKVFYDHRSNLQVYAKHDHYNRYQYASKRDINVDVLDEDAFEDLKDLDVFKDLLKDKAIADSRHAFNLLLATFEKTVINAYLKICNDFEAIGYDVYKVSDDDIKDLIDSNDYEFYEDGRIF
jgi:hypothetical protein